MFIKLNCSSGMNTYHQWIWIIFSYIISCLKNDKKKRKKNLNEINILKKTINSYR